MNKKIIFLCMAIFIFTAQSVFAASAGRAEFKVNYFSSSVIARTADSPRTLRIEIGLNKASDAYKAYASKRSPNELVVDLQKTKLGKVKRSIALPGGLAQKIQFSGVGSSDSRAVITLPTDAADANYKVYTLPKDKRTGKPFRIVIDVMDGPAIKSAAGLIGRTILLDAGHGGSDSGAIGPNGLKEKDVTFAVTNKVKAILNRSGAKVVMTRASDRDVYGVNASDSQELQARVDAGRRSGAELFLSIHANSFTKPAAHGTATYYYAKTARDGMLAKALQKGMVEAGGRYDRGTVEANFYVVKRSNMPAALVELAFISNPEEERLLGSDDFQQKLAEGICKGLGEYFAQVKE